VTVAVTGATGYVGRFIVKKLIAERMTVRAWRRPSSDLRGLPVEKIEWIEGDLATPEAAAVLVDGADMLVHAALDHVAGRYRRGEGDDLAANLRTNVGGGLALLASARKAGVKRAVVLSSRAVFGAEAVGPLSDDAPVSPDTHYGAAKAALEAFARSFAREGWPVAALRATGIYGVVAPVEKSKWLGLVQRALKGEAIEGRAGTEVHGDDAAEAIWRLLTTEPQKVAGRAFNCSDIVFSTRDIVGAVQKIVGVAGPLPAESPAPTGQMRSNALKALGVRFGGWQKFEATIAELVEAAR